MAKKSPYFDDFIAMAEVSCRAADYLQTVFREFSADTLEEHRQAMHKIEHEADDIKHEMMHRLSKEFVPPIDREDIIQLTNQLDNVTDKIDDILIRMYMYNVQQLRPAALTFAEVISRCCKAMHQAAVEFPNFHRSDTLMQTIIDVNSLEEEGDALYVDAVRELYTSGCDPVEITAWSALFDELEDCCDACEDVADGMEIVVMKNS